MPNNFLTNFQFSSFIKNPSANNNSCPDQVVGQLCNGKFQANQNRINIDYIKINNKFSISNALTSPILIILESPHINEFDPITGMALGPAMGNTGTNFKTYFDSILAKSTIFTFLSSATHDIILINAIQYQCSLGKPLTGKPNIANAITRDNNFCTCFNGGKKSNDLKSRITAIAPVAVINLCTKNLQQCVTNVANTYPNYTFGTHPSSWHKINNRKIN